MTKIWLSASARAAAAARTPRLALLRLAAVVVAPTPHQAISPCRVPSLMPLDRAARQPTQAETRISTAHHLALQPLVPRAGQPDQILKPLAQAGLAHPQLEIPFMTVAMVVMAVAATAAAVVVVERAGLMALEVKAATTFRARRPAAAVAHLAARLAAAARPAIPVQLGATTKATQVVALAAIRPAPLRRQTALTAGAAAVETPRPVLERQVLMALTISFMRQPWTPRQQAPAEGAAVVVAMRALTARAAMVAAAQAVAAQVMAVAPTQAVGQAVTVSSS